VIDDDSDVVSVHRRGTDLPLVSMMQKVAKVALSFEATADTIHGFIWSVRSIA
jgi:hypothetical protein